MDELPRQPARAITMTAPASAPQMPLTTSARKSCDQQPWCPSRVIILTAQEAPATKVKRHRCAHVVSRLRRQVDTDHLGHVDPAGEGPRGRRVLGEITVAEERV